MDTNHLFNCPRLPTDLGPEALWDDPGGAAGLLGGVWSGDSGGKGHYRSSPGSTKATTGGIIAIIMALPHFFPLTDSCCSAWRT